MRHIARTAFTIVAGISAIAATPGCITVGLGGKTDVPADRVHALDRAEMAPIAWRASVPSFIPERPPAPVVIAVRTFHGLDRFDRHVLQRAAPDADGRVRSLEHDFWADEPVHAVTVAVRESLATSGVFAAVVDPSDALDAQFVLDGTVLDFSCVDKPPAASFRVRLTLSEAKSGRVVASGAYEASEPFAADGAKNAELTGLGPAMGRAAGKALRQAVEEWRTSKALK